MFHHLAKIATSVFRESTPYLGLSIEIKEAPLKGHTFLSATSVGTNMTLAEGYLPRFLIHICSGALNLVLGSVVFTSRGCRAFPVAVTKLNSY